MRPEGPSPTPTSRLSQSQSHHQLSAQAPCQSMANGTSVSTHAPPRWGGVGADNRVSCFARGCARLLSESQELPGRSPGLTPPSPSPPATNRGHPPGRVLGQKWATEGMEWCLGHPPPQPGTHAGGPRDAGRATAA